MFNHICIKFEIIKKSYIGNLRIMNTNHHYKYYDSRNKSIGSVWYDDKYIINNSSKKGRRWL
jgi:hypothetical protein